MCVSGCLWIPTCGLPLLLLLPQLCTGAQLLQCTGAVAALLLQYARHLGIPSSNVAILGSVPVHNVGDDATVVDEDCGIAGNAT